MLLFSFIVVLAIAISLTVSYNEHRRQIANLEKALQKLYDSCTWTPGKENHDALTLRVQAITERRKGEEFHEIADMLDYCADRIETLERQIVSIISKR